MKITIDIPAGQEDAVLDAFADPGDDGRSDAVVKRKLTEVIVMAVASRAGQTAAREAAAAEKAAVEEAFGVTLPERQRGPQRPQ